MSNEPMLKRVTAQSPAAEARSDAERMQAALQRMKAAMRQPEAIERLRGELDEMKEVIANVRIALLTDSDPSALLDDLENRTERMMAAVIGGNAALPAEPPAAVVAGEPAATVPAKQPAAALPAEEPPPFDEQAFLDAMRYDPATEVATAPQGDTAPQAEPDRVPTVSSVFSQLGLAHDTGVEAKAGQATTVAMLESMVVELAASMPERPTPEADTPERFVETTSWPELAETVSLPEPGSAETAAEPDAVLSEPEPAAAAEASSPPEPSLETEAFAPDEPVAVTETLTSPDSIAAAQPPASQEPVSTAEHSIPEQTPVSPAEAAPLEARMPEVELLSSFARMETMPFLPPEVGTAVIFESRVKSDTTVEALAAEASPADQPDTFEEPAAAEPLLAQAVLVMPTVDLIEPSEPAVDQPQVAEPPAWEAAAEPPASEAPAEPQPGDSDLDALLFESQFEGDDPAASLLEPARWPAYLPPKVARVNEPAAPPQQMPAGRPQDRTTVPAVADPLAPLKAMSDEERIALFE